MVLIAPTKVTLAGGSSPPLQHGCQARRKPGLPFLMGDFKAQLRVIRLARGRQMLRFAGWLITVAIIEHTCSSSARQATF